MRGQLVSGDDASIYFCFAGTNYWWPWWNYGEETRRREDVPEKQGPITEDLDGELSQGIGRRILKRRRPSKASLNSWLDQSVMMFLLDILFYFTYCGFGTSQSFCHKSMICSQVDIFVQFCFCHLNVCLRISKRLFVFFLNGRNRDFGEKMHSNNLFKWSSKYSYLLFRICR